MTQSRTDPAFAALYRKGQEAKTDADHVAVAQACLEYHHQGVYVGTPAVVELANAHSLLAIAMNMVMS